MWLFCNEKIPIVLSLNVKVDRLAAMSAAPIGLSTSGKQRKKSSLSNSDAPVMWADETVSNVANDSSNARHNSSDVNGAKPDVNDNTSSSSSVSKHRAKKEKALVSPRLNVDQGATSPVSFCCDYILYYI